MATRWRLHSSTTNSDDDDDNSTNSESFTVNQLNCYAPADSGSAVAGERGGHVLGNTTDVDAGSTEVAGVRAGGFSTTAGPELMRVVNKRKRADFLRNTPKQLEEQYARPFTLPMRPDTLKEVVGWERRRVRDEEELRRQPWYQFLEIVSQSSGVPMRELVQFRTPAQLGGGSQRRFVSPHPPRVGLFGYPELRPEGIVAPEPKTPPGGSEEEVEEVRRPPVPKPIGATMQSGARPDRERLRYRIVSALVDDEMDQETMDNLVRQKRALDMLEQVERSDWQEEVSGLAFISPKANGAKRVARLMLANKYPGQLTNATVAELEASATLNDAFAILTGSVVSTGEYAGGRRPNRASDYDRYREGANFTLERFRFAVRNPRAFSKKDRIYLDSDALIQSRELRKQSLASWCPQYAGTGRDTSGETLRGALMETGQFKPLAGRDKAQSPYGGQSVFL